MIKFFKKKIKSILWHLFVAIFSKKNILEKLLTFEEKEALRHVTSGFLVDKGWWKSWKLKEPIDVLNCPLPWVTYSFIDFIEERLNKEMLLFEFGLGNSTFFYSSLVKKVHTVEHDREWYNKIHKKMPRNVKINYFELEPNGAYSKASQISEVKYDIIIVDGRDRVNCMLNALNSLNDSGVLILDDSERVSYKEGVDSLLKKGFKKIDFWGISPGFQDYNKSTSIFYKVNNVLNI